MSLARLASSLFVTLYLVAPAFADSTVKVSLWSKGQEMGMGMGMGMHGDMHMAQMGIDIDQASVPAGRTTFVVTNVSTDLIHEMLVAPITAKDVTMPYIANENRVNEEVTGDLGEVSELDPGKSGSLTVDLKPGNYVLYCNIPGHFVSGMWTTIVVK
jgi:uncharacterized cupredoxin-like copper-binding protein